MLLIRVDYGKEKDAFDITYIYITLFTCYVEFVENP